jgi:hypothetical protein
MKRGFTRSDGVARGTESMGQTALAVANEELILTNCQIVNSHRVIANQILSFF